jgi:hypothetical protein
VRRSLLSSRLGGACATRRGTREMSLATSTRCGASRERWASAMSRDLWWERSLLTTPSEAPHRTALRGCFDALCGACPPTLPRRAALHAASFGPTAEAMQATMILPWQCHEVVWRNTIRPETEMMNLVSIRDGSMCRSIRQTMCRLSAQHAVLPTVRGSGTDPAARLLVHDVRGSGPGPSSNHRGEAGWSRAASIRSRHLTLPSRRRRAPEAHRSRLW